MLIAGIDKSHHNIKGNQVSGTFDSGNGTRIYRRNRYRCFLATSVTKKLDHNKPKRNTDSLIKKLKAEQKRLETKKVSDYEKYKQGSISRRDFVEAKKPLNQHILEIEKELLALDKEIMASLIDMAIAVDENTVQVTWKNQDMYNKILSKL